MSPEKRVDFNKFTVRALSEMPYGLPLGFVEYVHTGFVSNSDAHDARDGVIPTT